MATLTQAGITFGDGTSQNTLVMPSGTKLMFAQASAPTGWTQITTDTANNRMLRVVNSTGGGTAGTHSPIINNVVPAHTHSVSVNEAGAHGHSISDPGHVHDIGGSETGTHDWGQWGGGGYNWQAWSGASATGITINTGGAHTHSGSTDNGSSQTNWQPRYIDLILCSKD